MAQEQESKSAVYVTDLGEQLTNNMDWLPEAWRPMWDMLADYPILGALGLIAIAYLLALLTRVIFVFVLEHLATRSKSEMDNIVLQNLRRPVFTTTFALGLVMAVQISALSSGASVLINVLTSAIVVSWMLAGLRLSSDVLSGLSANPKFNLVEPRTIPLFDLVIKLGILLFSSYGLLMIWGINPVGWLASAGIVGIAVGFAAKDTLANLFSGLFILADSPYQIGDYINLDSGERGMVTAIGMRSTRLLTRADVEITVPNAVIANAKITNESGGPYKKMRIRLPVGAAYGSDVDVVCDILQRTGEGHTETCGLPAPRVRMRGFGASSLDFELLAWIEQPADRGRISHELYIAIYKAFADQGIEIPFTKQDLYIKEMPK